MPVLLIVLIVLVVANVGYLLGRARALGSADGDVRQLHSLPRYYGSMSFIFTVVPAFVIMAFWLFLSPIIIDMRIGSELLDVTDEQTASADLLLSEVSRVAQGLENAVASGAISEEMASSGRADLIDMTSRLKDAGQVITQNVSVPVLEAAQDMRRSKHASRKAMAIVVILVALLGAALAVSKAHKDYRARNVVEVSVKSLLILASSIAILTTLGIVFSMLFNTVEFFRLYPASKFFASFTWSPSFGGGSELGIWPLLWGTLYISVIALAVAVPIGLFAAIYLSEYASNRVRSVAKPLLEILAGIPTIVYGLFALLTVGPLLTSVFGDGGPASTPVGHVFMAALAGLIVGLITLLLARVVLGALELTGQSLRLGPLALGLLVGIAIAFWIYSTLDPGQGVMKSGTAVVTAGLVMGIMLIPFVSSLSDDIINAVPQAMRDGSYGLGATQSETIRQVVLPAALPGIVGAVLLAASRAIGETMIVVLGAGAAARLSLNPFEAMTTITAKIVSQLTGDADFASPEALVAFALGMTLFVITLALNVFALYIVRKYQEQYD